MKQNSFIDELGIFSKYFAGYALLLLPIMGAIFDGRALVAQAAWYMGHIGVPNQVYVFNQGKSVAQQLAQGTQEVTINVSDYTIPSSVFQGDVNAFLVIPKIKVAAPVVFPNTIDDNALLSYLERGVIKYRDSADIGTPGTTIILGHSSAYPWYTGQFGSVFALLSQLEPGDQVMLATKNAKYIYQVSGRQVIMPQEFKIEQTDTGSHLVLMSCWPIRSNKLRMMVALDLIAKLGS